MNAPDTPRSTSRADVLDGLDQLREQGAIDADDEAAVIRHVDEHKLSMEEALARIAPEYQRRLESDGQAAADEWLAETARQLGESDGSATRRLVDSLG